MIHPQSPCSLTDQATVRGLVRERFPYSQEELWLGRAVDNFTSVNAITGLSDR